MLIGKTTVFNQTTTRIAPQKPQVVNESSSPEKISPPPRSIDSQTSVPKGSAITEVSFEPMAELKIATEQQIAQAVNQAITESFKHVPNRHFEDRHELNQRLQSLSPGTGTSSTSSKHPVHYDGSEVVVIAFEGTGAFDPRQAPIMQAVADKLDEQGLTLKGASSNFTTQIADALAQRKGKERQWSGLANGPLATLLENPEVHRKSQWLSFPSEELEVLATPDGYKSTSIMDILEDSVGSYVGSNPGINQALKAVLSIQEQAKAQGKQPKFMIVTHSSGGRSAVKFLELAKKIKSPESGQSVQFPFVMTIDPVREAHEALFEAGKELLYKGTEHNMNAVRSWFEWAGVEQKKVYPPLVRSRSQPESLYKPGNTGKFVNFYQKKDTEGLKMSPKFGIHGSPIKGAENHQIYNLGTAGHGEIAYNQKVTSTFMDGLQNLLPSK